MSHNLVVKMSSLGDVVHALPALSDAAAHGHTFDWVVEEAFADVPALHPAVERVIPVAWRRWRTSLAASRDEMDAFWHSLRGKTYDCVIDAQGLIKSAVVSLMARGRAEGFSHTSAREPWAAFAYRRGHLIPRRQHAIDRQRQLFAAALGYPLTEQCPPLRVADVHTPARRVVFLHGTTWATKHWPESMWVSLSRLAHAAGWQVALPWGNPAEKARAERIAELSDAQVLDRMALGEVAEVLGKSALVVGVDSGLTHLSAALGTPTLGLYGPTDAALTGCRGVRAVSVQSGLACSPCLDQTCRRYGGAPIAWQGNAVQPPCFATLPPDEIWRHCQTLLAAQ